MHKLFPRLSASQAVERLATLQNQVNAGQHTKLVEVTAPHASPNPTGGVVATWQEIQVWRESVVQSLSSRPMSSPQDAMRFGLEYGQALVNTLPLSASDAGHDGVWCYLSLHVFPDVVLQRWPPNKEVLAVDRWTGRPLGRDRNYSKLCWRREQLFGSLLREINPPLGEDEFGALTERTAVARDHRLIRECARAVGHFRSNDKGRAQYTRDLMKLVTIQTGSRVLDLLSDRELAEVVQECNERARSMGARRAIR